MKPKDNGKTAIRTRQRAHAKARFAERFGLTLNRDRIREIEQKISSGQAVRIESKRRALKNYFVAVEGKLLAVGYDGNTSRVVTALPDEYVSSLPSELVAVAKLLLLPGEAEAALDQIASGRATCLYRMGGTAFFCVDYHGEPVRIGYSKATKRLVRYEPEAEKADALMKASGNGSVPALLKIAPLLDCEPEIAEEFRSQIRSGKSAFLWRLSSGLKFHEVQRDGKPYRVGYSAKHGTLHVYIDPPEHMKELRSSLRLLGEPERVRSLIVQAVNTGVAGVVPTSLSTAV